MSDSGTRGDDTAEQATPLETALLEEAAKKSALVWVRTGDGPARPLWHVWHDGAVCVVVGPGEQDAPGLAEAGRAVLVLRGKDKGGRLLSWPVTVRPVPADDPRWPDLARALQAERLNAADHDGQLARWAAGCALLRLVPEGAPAERPGAMPRVSHAAPPPGSPATTLGPLPRNLSLGRRSRRG